MRSLVLLSLGSLGVLTMVACGDDAPAGDDVVDIDAAAIDAAAPDAAPVTCFDEEATFTGEVSNVFAINPALGAPLSPTAPDFQPGGGSPALTGAATPPAGFFDAAATYYGAIGATDWTETWTAFPTNQVPADDGVVTTLAGTGDVLEITASTTWSGTIKLPANLKVYVKSGAVLTVAAGTIIKGGAASAIIVTKTGRIEAVGTVADPIVMTSDQADGSAAAGDWSGLILLGGAAINVAAGDATIEGLEPANPDNHYGAAPAGAVATHDCGTLTYVRIEYAGTAISGGNEIQGLTVGACGSDTTIDYLQVHRADDDGIEVFGGTSDFKHLVISQPSDDGLDWDQGWTGRVQYLIVQQPGDKVMECDNNKNASNALPISAPIIYNATLVGLDADGSRGQEGIHFRVGTGGTLRNAIITGFPDFAIDVDGPASVQRVADGVLSVRNTMFFHNGVAPEYDSWVDDFDVFAPETTQNDCPAL